MHAAYHRIFISYRRADHQPTTERIYDRLVAKFGAEAVFIDYVAILPGVKWRDTLLNAATRADLMVVVIGPRWLELLAEKQGREDWVHTEVQTAAQNGKAFVPVTIAGADLPKAEQLPEAMRPLLDYQGLAIGQDRDFERHCDELIASIERELAKLPPPAQRFEGYPGDLEARLLTRPDKLRRVRSQHLRFVGRSAELDQLSADLRNGQRQMLLQGVGGQGKTTLASKVAEKFLQDQPDKPVLWLRAGTDAGDALYDKLAKPFGAEQLVNRSLDKADALEDVLAASGIGLLVLDDCWDASALADVLRAAPPDLPVLATARQLYPLPANHLTLHSLTPDDAWALLRQQAPQQADNEADGKALAAKLGHLAYGVELAGVQMRLHNYSAQDLMQRVDVFEMQDPDAMPGRRSIAALLQASINTLSEEAQAAYWACGAFWGRAITPELLTLYETDLPHVSDDTIRETRDFNRQQNNPIDHLSDDVIRRFLQTQALAGLDTTPAANLLNELARNGFGAWLRDANDPQGNPHTSAHLDLEDIAHEYAQYKATDAMHQRALDACLRLLPRHNTPSLQNFAALRPLLPTLLGAQAHAAAQGRHADVEQFAWDLYVGSHFLNLQGYNREALVLLARAAHAADQTQNAYNRAAHRNHRGLCLRALGDVRAAIAAHEDALAIARAADEKQVAGDALGNLGNAYANLGQYQQAIAYYEQALVIRRAIGDRRGEGGNLGNLGNAYRNLGQYQQAIDYHTQALAIRQEIGDRRGEGADLGNLGNAYLSLGQYQQAIDYYTQQLVIVRQIGDRRGEGNALGNLGLAYADLGQYQQAIDYHTQALAISQEIGDRLGEGNRLGNLGNAYADLGQYQQAIAYHTQALAISQEIGDRRGEGDDLNNLGVAYEYLEDYDRALTYYQQALAIQQALGVPHLIEQTERNIADVRGKQGGAG